ncbi:MULTISPECIES: urea ABC transporter permease subunit UrtB [unclassified Alcanivorax]|uniref:urea ABC transporter permease subunit UrtB n=1 Tax=unclassified Alcanivorax TaxID=2638842 RepID=UPI0007BA8414|nr:MULTISPECIES: urea ABC transporter permease subunit UrtB [unclassified Alcanivorax]KZX79159.1 urea ABC transporter permease subunit UrtB [Alcanivorax sp. HI0011]KZY08918.1 urea ABC transporter permease subunit UrtB [Alcanivorax sp. HI0035]KZX63111.1 urea ABC transporter permease subunit UrtB [Alcanivorax sp. HI0003]KZX67188.1 urea ABC transporter permease subunit UrtB [Alcanivorax sp. HI0007]KZY05462.1 urea ABC transporter permease subunit UrtB [Alcanivorax sp. HI0033]
MGHAIGRFLTTLLLAALCNTVLADLATDTGPAPGPGLHDILNQLASRNFDDKEAAIHQLAEQDHPRVVPLLNALMNRDLVQHRDSGAILLGRKNSDGWLLLDPVSEAEQQQVGSRDARPVVINNRLRTVINNQLALRDLASPDSEQRYQAAGQLIGNADPEMLSALTARRAKETVARVQDRIDVALNIATLDNNDLAARLNAIDALADSLHPAAKNALRDRVAASDNPAEVRAAEKALARIEARIERYQTADTLFFGLSLGSVLLLAAIGLAITFGVMGVINMAHGELIMIGAYTTYVIQQLLPNSHEWSLLIAIPAAFVVSALVGILIERFVIRFLYGRPLETLLATFGVSLILQQAVRVIFSPLNRTVVTPEWMSGALEINPVFSLTYNRLYIIFFALAVFLALLTLLKKTRLGLQVRAVSQNRTTARAMGIRSERVNALTFGLGSGIAGIAGVALAQLTNVGPNLGQSYIIDSFMVVVFGGVGNLWGTLTAAFSLGIANKLLEPMAGAVLAKIIVLIFIILFIQRKPRGLFPQRGRAAEE